MPEPGYVIALLCDQSGGDKSNRAPSGTRVQAAEARIGAKLLDAREHGVTTAGAVGGIRRRTSL